MNILQYNKYLNSVAGAPNGVNNILDYNRFLPTPQPTHNNVASPSYPSEPSYGNSNGSVPNGGDPLAAYNKELSDLNNKTNEYFTQQQGIYQGGHDINSKFYGDINNQLLGTQNQGARDSFLNSVYTPDMKSQGSAEYGYNMNLINDNALYGLQQTANAQNRQLALAKLANDENWAIKGINLSQGKQNQGTLEDLNSRGLLYGQSPTGGYQPNAIGGVNGIAGQEAGLVNQDFANQRGSLAGGYGLGQQGVNQTYNQLGAQQTQQHNYDVQDLGYGTANSINQQNAGFAHDTGSNDNALKLAQAQLKQQQYDSQNQNKIGAQKITGSNFQS